MCSDEKNRNAAKGHSSQKFWNKVGIPFEIRAFNETFRLYKQFDEKIYWKQRRNLERVIPTRMVETLAETMTDSVVNKASYH